MWKTVDNWLWKESNLFELAASWDGLWSMAALQKRKFILWCSTALIKVPPYRQRHSSDLFLLITPCLICPRLQNWNICFIFFFVHREDWQTRSVVVNAGQYSCHIKIAVVFIIYSKLTEHIFKNNHFQGSEFLAYQTCNLFIQSIEKQTSFVKYSCRTMWHICKYQCAS